jgi:hypothetical protein
MSESARISKGDQSEQDAASPPEFMRQIERRFGPLQFDLAAHAGNKKHARYFAPRDFVEAYDPAKVARGIFVRRLMRAGAHLDEVEAALDALGGKKGKIRVPNHDPEAFGLDAFKFDWSHLSQHFHTSGSPGLLYDNCEYNDIERYAEKHAIEAKRGANSLLLTPASVGSNWWRDHCAGVADTYLLNGRITFIGSTAPYPKDLALSHFHPGAVGLIELWDWRERPGAPAGTVHQRWGDPSRTQPFAPAIWGEHRRSPEAA